MIKFPKKKEIFESKFWSFLFRIYFKIELFLENDIFYAKKRYKKVYGRKLDLRKPQYFHEKLQWLKLYDRKDIYVQCADKLTVRDYVRKIVGEEYLIPILRVYESSEELDSGNLPEEQFILKCNHNSGSYTIVKNKDRIDWAHQRTIFHNLLRQNYYDQGREWQYRDIKPRIIAEKLLLNEDGSIPFDFKLFCLNGRVELIQVDLDREENHTRNLYDLDWNLLPYTYCYPNGRAVKKPERFDEMVRLAERLSKVFPFARVDFYYCQGKVFFGEITFHPEGGFGVFDDDEVELSLGKKLSLEYTNN